MNRDPRRLRRRQGLGASPRAELDAEVELLLDPGLSRRARARGRAPLPPERRRDHRDRSRLALDRPRDGEALRDALLRRQGLHRRRAQCSETGRYWRLHRAAVRAAHRLCADDRRQLGRADRRFPPDRGQGRAGFAGQLLRRRGQEDRADNVRGSPRQLHPDPRFQRVDPLSAAKERLTKKRRGRPKVPDLGRSLWRERAKALDRKRARRQKGA